MRRGQVAIYIIVAIVLILLIVFVFVVRREVGREQMPQEFKTVFDYYSECVAAETRLAVNLAGAGGGRIFIKDYVPGSEHAPFASHLNFLGSPVEYWYYVAGNGVIKENVPTLNEIEDEIARFVEQGIKNCDFEYFYKQGFSIQFGEPRVNVEVLESKIKVNVDAELSVSRGEQSAARNSHYVEINSKLGKFYNLATDIYREQAREAFLERYAVDVLYNYAPVDGVEIQCTPKIWQTRKVIDELRTGLQENIQTIKFKGNYYSLKDKQREYFVYDKRVDEPINFLYFKDWPSRIEIYGDGVDDELMIAEPIGNAEGMGILGFCYVPYHFVYDISFPVMVQIYSGSEIFQFPVVVIIDKNIPRKALEGKTYWEGSDFELCRYMTQSLEVRLYDPNLNSVDGNVSFECFNQRCRLGESEGGVLRTPAPACVNGYLHVRAGGFADKKELISTNRQNFVEVILERERKVKVELLVGGREIKDDLAVVSFTRDDGKVKTIAMPEQREVELSEGSYEVKVYVYGNSSITIPASTKTQCVEVARGGIMGLFGATREECFEINLPATKIESSLVGGGVSNTYFLDSELSRGVLKIRAERLPRPTSLEQLSQNFELFEDKRLWMEFDDA